MARLSRAFDWASTPLGPVDGWPPSLTATVRNLITARNPMFLYWGPELPNIRDRGARAPSSSTALAQFGRFAPYLGFNSGPLVQREHIFYERYADVTTSLRVHAIPGILDFFDYSPVAAGMVYRNNHNPGGLTIDGRPDGHRPGPLEWESMQGTPGTMVTVHTLGTTIAGLARTSFYDDAAISGFIQCTGDTSAFGASGNWITSAVPNTDPRTAAFPAR
jgi:hypothetical protein